MGRVLVIVLIVVVAVWLLRRALAPRAGTRTSAPPPTPIGGELVACARCGLNLPRAEAREAGGGLYCSDEHARLGRG